MCPKNGYLIIYAHLVYGHGWTFTLILKHTSCLLACYLLPNHIYFSCCSPIVPAFGMGHFVLPKLYCGIINQDSTLVVCSNGRCYFTSNTLVSAVQTGFRRLLELVYSIKLH